MKIGLLGPYGSGNLGDAAIQEAVISNIKTQIPEAEIFGFSVNPDDTEKRHGIKAFPLHIASGKASAVAAWGYSSRLMRKLKRIWGIRVLAGTLHTIFFFLGKFYDELMFLRHSYRILKALDMLVVSGGGQLDDYWGGAWGHPFALLKWAIAAQLAKTKLVILSVGACDLNSKLSRFFFRYALTIAHYRSFRDETTKRIAEDIGVRGENYVFPDLAYSLELQDTYLPRICHDKERLVVGISPISSLAWKQEIDHCYQCYLSTLTEMVQWLVKKEYQVIFFASQVRMDNEIIDHIMNRLIVDNKYNNNDSIIVKKIWSLEDLLFTISNIDVVVASRLHGVLISHLLYKPVLALSYHRKVDTLMSEMCLSDYCIDINNINFDSLIDSFSNMINNKELIADHIKDKVCEYKTSLYSQYKYILNK